MSHAFFLPPGVSDQLAFWFSTSIYLYSCISGSPECIFWSELGSSMGLWSAESQAVALLKQPGLATLVGMAGRGLMEDGLV